MDDPDAPTFIPQTCGPETGQRREGSRRSPGKHKAILDAATEIFLRNGFLGTSMDEVALQSAVSKQTVYQHFASKEALFVEIVTTMTDAAGDAVLAAAPALPDGGDVGEYLQDLRVSAAHRRAHAAA